MFERLYVKGNFLGSIIITKHFALETLSYILIILFRYLGSGLI